MAKSAMCTVVVLGASYGGCPAVKILAEKLPRNCKLIAIDRNTHMNRRSSPILYLDSFKDSCSRYNKS